MKFRRFSKAFTMVELLAVIAIIALMAVLVGPTLKNFSRGDRTASATRQLLDAVARARQLAITQRTTVYMVFVPTNFWNNPVFFINNPVLTGADWLAATNMADRQLTSYNFVSLHSMGDQPGRNNPRYLSAWQSLPDGTFVAFDKFTTDRNTYLANLYTLSGFKVYGFDVTTNIPFPLAETLPYPNMPPYPRLPYIAFNYLGQLTTEPLAPRPSQHDEFIPLAHGAVSITRDGNKVPVLVPFPAVPPSMIASETPAGNSTNNYNLVHIDWLTGRARLEHREVK
jgi:prepilin-type N-terminal cleavage/methylation domain-containing protein